MTDINLFPWREDQRIKARRAQWFQLLSAAGFALLLLLVCKTVLQGQIQGAKQRISLMEERLENVNKRVEAAKTLYQSMGYQKIPETDLDFILNHQQKALVLLEKLAQRLPHSLVLRQLRLGKIFSSMAGSAAGINEVWQYIGCLKGLFKQVNLLELEQQEGLFNFHLKMEMMP